MWRLLSFTKWISHPKFNHKCVDAEHTKLYFNDWHLDGLKVSWDDNYWYTYSEEVSLKKLTIVTYKYHITLTQYLV